MRALGAALVLLGRSVRGVRTHGFPWRELARQLHEMGNQLLPLVAVGLGAFGAGMVAHADHEARPIVQDIAVVGPPFFHLLVREFAPVLVGALAALKIGSMVAAELGTMAQTEQLEALVMSAGDPAAELVAPRIAAGLLSLPVLLIVGTAVAAGCARLTATYAYASDGHAWVDPLLTTRADALIAMVKALAFGLAIPLAAASRGLQARGGATSVGRATTEGAVSALMAVMAIDLLIALGTALVGL